MRQFSNQKYLWADDLRLIAIIGVIILHVIPNLLYTTSVSDSVFWLSNIYASSFRFSVPIFVMLSGALVLQKDYGLLAFIRSKFLRLLLPFVFWSLIYIVYNLVCSINGDLNLLLIIKLSINYLINGSSFHLWYIYMIIGVYLFIPIIGKWIRSCSESEILYFLAIWFITLILNLPYINKYIISSSVNYFSGYIGYLILGYYISIKEIPAKYNIIPISILLIVVGLLITIFGTYFLYVHNGRFQEDFYNYLSPNVLLVSLGLFLFFKNNNFTLSKYTIIRTFICKYSYGIYLVHVLVLYLLIEFGVKWTFLNPIVGVPITTACCLLISAAIVYILNKIPFGKYFAG